MNGEAVLLDSVILIDHFNGIRVAADYLKRVAPESSISAITRAEVLTGFEGDRLPLARALFDRFPLLASTFPRRILPRICAGRTRGGCPTRSRLPSPVTTVCCSRPATRGTSRLTGTTSSASPTWCDVNGTARRPFLP